MIADLLGQRASSILLDIGAVGLFFNLVWGATKMSYERVVGEPMPRKGIVLFLDILTDLLPNILGVVHTIGKSKGGGLFLPQAQPKPEDR